jgi:hypothetical protein
MAEALKALLGIVSAFFVACMLLPFSKELEWGIGGYKKAPNQSVMLVS